ncbi:hypothetical protein Tco_1287648, partial [Tanacetum coccineum]
MGMGTGIRMRLRNGDGDVPREEQSYSPEMKTNYLFRFV